MFQVEEDARVRGPVALTKDVCLIGRDAGVHLPLRSALVSKVHALVVRDANGVYVRDLASRNRVLVNGQPVREAGLHAGDLLQVGPFELRCAAGFTRPPAERDDRFASARPRPGRARLEVRDEDGGAPRVVPLDARAVLIGTRDECEVVVRGADEGGAAQVGPVHAVVFERDGRWFVRDLNFGGPTRVNGLLVHQRELRAGDEIAIGRSRIAFLADAPRSSQDQDLEELERELGVAPLPEDDETPVIGRGMGEDPLAAHASDLDELPTEEAWGRRGRS